MRTEALALDRTLARAARRLEVIAIPGPVRLRLRRIFGPFPGPHRPGFANDLVSAGDDDLDIHAGITACVQLSLSTLAAGNPIDIISGVASRRPLSTRP